MNRQLILEMTEEYPFGQLGQHVTEETRVFVEKLIKAADQEEVDLVKQMVHFLKAARHPALINLERVLEDGNQVRLFYEYVPFRLEKWVVAVNEDLVEKMEAELLDLVEFLARSSLRFKFDPACLGVDSQMRPKYFLNHFTVDCHDASEDIRILSADIKNFFKGLVTPSEKEQEEENKIRFGSLSTNGSLSPHKEPFTLTRSFPTNAKAPTISSRLQQSVQKSIELLNRLKKK